MGTETTDVPCGTCHHCCQKELIPIRPERGDDPSAYDTFEAVNPTTGKRERFLRHQPNGDCIYLGAAGCTIHGRQPATCKAFDCRQFFLWFSKRPAAQRQRLIATRPRVKETVEIGKRMQAEHPAASGGTAKSPARPA
jgi:Fe-S-cluster containining protein